MLESAPSRTPGIIKNVLLGILSAGLAFSLNSASDWSDRLKQLETRQASTEEKFGKQLAATQGQLREATAKVGVTQKEIKTRSASLLAQQKESEVRLTEEQKKQQQALGAVSTEVGGVKSDVASTRSDLEATKAKLEHAIGDLGIASGLIATTREDLDVLKHKGDRNYYDFSLTKGASPVPVSTVSLQLKKADRKKGKYTLTVLADDRTIEKKDRNVNEPLQFYTGRDKALYELVVFTVEKDKVTGYIATPKSAPKPVSR